MAWSLDAVVFGEVVFGAEKLDVLRGEGGAAKGVGDDVVKVKILVGTALDALAFVPFPHVSFHAAWDNPGVFNLAGLVFGG